MTTERTATVNALTALLRVAAPGVDARKPLTLKQITEVSHWRTRAEGLATAPARAEAVRLAKRVVDLTEVLTTNQVQMTGLIREIKAAALMDETGIGPVTAAVVYTAGSHPGRVRSEPAFAALAGADRIPASSGNTTRHRFNRGGDRRLNRPLHMAVVTRMAHDPDTRAYVDRRCAEGRTTKEIRRCLKRYLARQLYRHLEKFHAESDCPPSCLTRHRRVHRGRTSLNGKSPVDRVPNLPGQNTNARRVRSGPG